MIKVLTRYYNLWKKYGEKLGLDSELQTADQETVLDVTFQNTFGKLHKHVSWHIGMMAYKLIKKEAKPKKEEEKENEDENEDVKKKRRVEKYRE